MASKLFKLVLLGNDAANSFTSEWDELVETNPYATVFQSSGWYLAWIKTVATTEKIKPIVLKIISSSGSLRAALALQISNTNNIPTICPLSSPWADYHEVVAKPDDIEAIRALSKALNELVWDWQFPLVCDDIVFGGIMETVLLSLSMMQSSSNFVGAIDLTDTTHVERILSKKEYVLKWQRLQRLGQVCCYHHTQLDAVIARLPIFIEMHRKQWAERPDAVAPFDGGTVDKTFKAMVQYLAPHKLIILTELLLDHQAIAMYFGFLYRNCYGGYRTAFDRTYHRLSPGHLMLHRMIVDFASSGIHKIDLMRGAYAYKLTYTNKIQENQRFELRSSLSE